MNSILHLWKKGVTLPSKWGGGGGGRNVALLASMASSVFWNGVCANLISWCGMKTEHVNTCHMTVFLTREDAALTVPHRNILSWQSWKDFLWLPFGTVKLHVKASPPVLLRRTDQICTRKVQSTWQPCLLNADSLSHFCKELFVSIAPELVVHQQHQITTLINLTNIQKTQPSR